MKKEQSENERFLEMKNIVKMLSRAVNNRMDIIEWGISYKSGF